MLLPWRTLDKKPIETLPMFKKKIQKLEKTIGYALNIGFYSYSKIEDYREKAFTSCIYNKLFPFYLYLVKFLRKKNIKFRNPFNF